MKYIIRELKFKDFFSLNRMYDLVSEDSKLKFHPGFLGFKSISFKKFLTQIILLISCIKVLNNLLISLFPRAVFFSIVALNQREVIGYAFLKLRNRTQNKYFVADLGIVVMDDYQGKGLGSKLLESLINMAKDKHINAIYLTVLKSNSNAVKIYQKYGFKRKKYIKNGDCWLGIKYDSIEMYLHLGK